MMKYLSLFFVILLFYSCDNPFNETENQLLITKSYNLIIDDTIEINLDRLTKYNGNFQLVRIESTEYLGSLNKDYNTYSLFNLKSCLLEKTIKFHRNGPNGIGQARFIYLHNWDSIFISRYHTNKVFMVDSSSTIISKWELKSTTLNKNIFHTSANFRFLMKLKGSNLHLLNISESNVFSKQYWNENLGLVFNLSNNKLTNNSGSFPDIYKQGINFGEWNYKGSRVITANNLQVYSFSLENKLYIYNDTSLIKSVSLPSSYVSVKTPIPTKTLTGYNSLDDWIYEIQRGSYRWMAYDEQHKIIYRLVVHAMEPYDTEGNKNKFWDKPFSIQIIDSTFSLIGEVDFPSKQYDFRNITVSKDGLLISLCHNDNPILEEDKLKLARFKLVKKDE